MLRCPLRANGSRGLDSPPKVVFRSFYDDGDASARPYDGEDASAWSYDEGTHPPGPTATGTHPPGPIRMDGWMNRQIDI